ncbi:unnamed protein product, partial [marine sediment metagenome]
IVSDFFRQTLENKIKWEIKLEKNFLEELPAILKKGVDKMIDILGELFATSPGGKGAGGGGFWGGLASTVIGGIVGGIGSLGGALFGGGTAAASNVVYQGSDVMPWIRAHSGALTHGPALATVGDNPSGIEAIIPSERFGDFFGRGQGGVVVNVHNYSRSNVGVREGSDGTRKIIDVIVGQAEEQVARSVITGGKVGRAMTSVFGLNRTGGA